MCDSICFFFQAEDGIRDLTVTGVQTCALPIYQTHTHKREERCWARRTSSHCEGGGHRRAHRGSERRDEERRGERGERRERSEERRVGKECRSRWSPYH